MEEEKEPLLVLRPRFNALLYFLSKHFLTLLAIIFLTCIVTQYTPEGYEELPSIAIFIIVVYIIYMVIKGLLEKRKYNRMQYLFYSDRLLLIDQRKKRENIEILYTQMFDVIMIQNYLDKFTNQGKLIIKLSNSKLFGKHVELEGIGNFNKTTQEIASIIYGNQNAE